MVVKGSYDRILKALDKELRREDVEIAENAILSVGKVGGGFGAIEPMHESSGSGMANVAQMKQQLARTRRSQ